MGVCYLLPLTCFLSSRMDYVGPWREIKFKNKYKNSDGNKSEERALCSLPEQWKLDCFVISWVSGDMEERRAGLP